MSTMSDILQFDKEGTRSIEMQIDSSAVYFSEISCAGQIIDRPDRGRNIVSPLRRFGCQLFGEVGFTFLAGDGERMAGRIHNDV